MIINHVEVTDVKSNGVMKAMVRLGGIVTGSFRKRVNRLGRVQLFLPGGTMFKAESGWRIYEPISIYHDGRFVNQHVKAEIYRLCGEWWKRHKTNEPFNFADQDKIRFADSAHTEPVELFVRPVSYIPPDQADPDREWDAGRLDIVLRVAEKTDIVVRINVRRYEAGLMASIPKWTIEGKDLDALGREVETKSYAPKLHFNIGAENADGQILGAATILWAHHFKVKEPIQTLQGRCASCRFLEFLPEDRPLTEKEDQIGRRWWCSKHQFYVDDAQAVQLKRMAMEQGFENTAHYITSQSRFYNGCSDWAGRQGQMDVKSLKIVSPSLDGEQRVASFLENDCLSDLLIGLETPEIRFETKPFHNREFNEYIPSVPVTIKPLIDGRAGDPNDPNPKRKGVTPTLSSEQMEKKKAVEEMLKGMNVLAVTGHRPDKIGGYDSNPLEPKVRARIAEEIRRAYAAGFNAFVSGGALGVDMIFAEEVIKFKEEDASRKVVLVIARPFPSQSSAWKDKKLIDRYQAILKKADRVVDVSPDPFHPWKMQKRNEWMVDLSRAVLAVWDGSSGGTANCVRYAQKKGVPIKRINPKELHAPETQGVNQYKEEYDVYCGRGPNGEVPDVIGKTGWLGNPVAIGKPCPVCGGVHNDGESTLPCYKRYLFDKLKSDPKWAKAFFETCYGKRLGCFCKPKPCHTDVMVDALKWLKDNPTWK